MPLISVVIPVYNGEETIKQTLESVLEQTEEDFEIIIIDDGSQDSSLEKISSIQDARLKVFKYPNAGVSISRNRGIAHASGEFIAFLDHDDLWTPNKLESQLKALQENPQAGVAYSWTDYIDESGQFLRSGNRIAVTGDVYGKLLVRNFLENGSNPLIRRQALIELGGFERTLSPADDWEMYLRLASRYHFVAVPSTQILYRVSANSMSCNVSKLEAASLQVIERAFNEAPESLQHLKKYSLSTLYMYLLFKVLEAPSERQTGLVAARCLLQAVRNDPSVFRRWQTMLKALFKITAVAFLPGGQSQAFIATAKSIFGKFNKLAEQKIT